MLYQRRDIGKDARLGEMLSQQLMGMFVHTEEKGNVAFPQDVAQNHFIVSLGEVVIEEVLRLFVLE